MLGQAPQDPLHSATASIPFSFGTLVAPGAETSTAQTAQRYDELDGHRGVAAVAVVIFHVYQFCNVAHFLYLGTPAYRVLNSLDAAVPWFFVLTAFLLFEPIARSAIQSGPAISARGYLVRRAVRVLPVYYVAVVVVWFWRQPSLPGDWRDLLEHLTFTQVFDHKRIFYTNGPAWSLSVEVFFYLVLIVLAVGLARVCKRLVSHRQRIALLAASTAALAAVSLAWKAWSFGVAHRSPTGSFTTWFGPVANLDSFAAGMAVAIITAAFGTVRPLGRIGRRRLRLIGVGILVVAFATRQSSAWSGVYFSTTCAIAFACLVAAVALGSPGGRWSRTLTWQPLLWLGTISYSLYLWHEPILLALSGWQGLVRQRPDAFVLDTAIVLVVSILAGWLSYALIERPTSRLGGIFGRDGRLVLVSGHEAFEWESFRSGNPL